MVSSSLKRNVDYAADSSDLQIFKMNSFVFGAAIKTNRFMFIFLISS
jgi:hypothetical protein